MAERPRSRQTVIVGGLTVVAILLIAAIFLLIQSPWNDPGPRPLHKNPKSSHASSATHT